MQNKGIHQATEADRIKSLQTILEGQQQRSVTYDEALEVGESLIDFFELLSDNPGDPLEQLITTEKPA